MFRPKGSVVLFFILVSCLFVRVNSVLASLTDGLVVWYTFDDASGTMAVDLSGNGHHGTLSGKAIWTRGQVGGALDFDAYKGERSAVTVTNAASIFGSLNKEISISCWTYDDASAIENQQVAVWGAKAGTSGNLGIYLLDRGNNIQFFAKSAQTRGLVNKVASSDADVQNKWIHWAFCKSAATIKIYKDGVEIYSANDDTVITDSVDTLTIGGIYEGSNNWWPYPGKMDDFRLYNRALSAVEVSELYNQSLLSNGSAAQVDCTAVEAEQAGSDVALFYPGGVNRQTLPPSFALVAEPAVTGSLSSSWDKKPTYTDRNGSYTWTLDVAKGTSLYGTGEVTGDLERTGTVVELWNTDSFKYSHAGGKRLYQSHPWVMGVRADGTAFGVMADTTFRLTIDLTNGIRFESSKAPFRVLVIDKESPQDVMKALGALTGTMEMPPMWALGYQQCRWSYYPDSRVRDIADGFRSRDIPCDVIWLDIHYMDGYRVFTFDKSRFPTPAGLNAYLHKKGFKSVWMIDPGVKVDTAYSVYQSGGANDVWVKNNNGDEYHGDVWPGPCVFPDYTAPHVATWWGDLYKNYLATGIDGVWNDMNEPAVFKGGTMPDDNQHRGGVVLPNGRTLPAGTHAQYHNVYGMLMVKASRDGILAARPDKRPFVLSRSNFLGGHRYAATWTGDNASTEAHMKLSIPMSLTLGLSGQPFNGPDAGGFAGTPTTDLMGHWLSLAAFYPFSRGHAMEKAPDKEPWEFGATVEEAAKISFEKRYRLMPYLYTLFREASQTGMPVMRPLFFADPANQNLRTEDEAFLFGGDLLVIPQWATLPNLPTNFTKQVAIVDGANGYLPELRVRDGAIIPLTKIMQNTTQYDHSVLTLLVRLDQNGQAAGSLYEDDNDGWDFKSGEYRLTTFSAQQVGNRVVVRTENAEGQMNIPTRNIKIEIVLDDRTVTATKREAVEMWVDL